MAKWRKKCCSGMTLPREESSQEDDFYFISINFEAISEALAD